jgi:hypothetical protein
MISRHRIAAATVVALVLAATQASAQTGRIVRDSVRSRALAGNLLGDSPTREVLVYLPPGYDRSPGRRYPAGAHLDPMEAGLQRTPTGSRHERSSWGGR